MGIVQLLIKLIGFNLSLLLYVVSATLSYSLSTYNYWIEMTTYESYTIYAVW